MGAMEKKVAIVTGASSGIGRASAELFAAEGAAVVLVARREAVLVELARQIEKDGGRAAVVAGDVCEEDTARRAVALAVERFGGLDVALDNAGGLGPMGGTAEVSLQDWESALRVNLTSAFLSAKHQIPAMIARGGGSIVVTSTFVGHTVGMPGMAAYAASKAGVIGLVRALAVEVAAAGVRVNALLPGGSDTPMGRVVASSPEALEYVRGLHAMKRLATPEEIARSALYLASDASSFTTGIALLADGGVSIHRA